MSVYKSAYPADTEHKECFGLLVCPHCGDAVMCSNVHPNHVIRPDDVKDEGEKNNMIPRGNSSSNQSNQKGKRKSSGFRFLSVDMLSSTHSLATIEEAKMQPDNFNPDNPDVLVVKLKFKGEFILWTLRANNPNLETLGDAFGDDETKWSGNEVELYIEEDNFTGKKWIRSEAVTANSIKSGKGKR